MMDVWHIGMRVAPHCNITGPKEFIAKFKSHDVRRQPTENCRVPESNYSPPPRVNMRMCELHSRSGIFREQIGVFPLMEFEPRIVRSAS
jgi:hypothetical protein